MFSTQPSQYQPFGIPIELSLKIFSYLTYEDMLSLTFISKSFNAPPLWKYIFQYFYDGPYKGPSTQSDLFYKKEYVQRTNDKINFPYLWKAASQNQREQMTIAQKSAVEKLLVFLSESQKNIGEISFHTTLYSHSFHRTLFVRNPTIQDDIEIAEAFRDFILSKGQNSGLLNAITKIEGNLVLTPVYLDLVKVGLLPSKDQIKDQVLDEKIQQRHNF